MLASCNDNWQSTPYECCSVLEDRFLLLGYHDGVQLVDLEDPDSKPKTIIWIRARDISVIESCRVVLILAGRYKQVRCYSYDALLRLIYAVLSIDWSLRKDKRFDVPSMKDWEYISSLSGKVREDEPSLEEFLPVSQNNNRKEPSFTQVNLVELPISSLTKPYYTVNQITLQKFFYKLPESKDALSVQTYQTSVYVFAAIRHRDKIVLWQRKRDHPLRPFCRLKVFWIPSESKWISFADDRSTLRHILVVFANEATAIELRDSKVKTVPIDPILERIYQTTWVREQYEHQLNSPRSPNSPIPTLFSRQLYQPEPNNNDNNSSTYPTLPVSLSVPPIQWTSLIQLPFYPDILPATTLTTEYSIPPSYSTVITSLPSSAPPDPIALPSASAPQLFFATLLKQSYIIDLSGSLFSTQVYKWTEVPIHIEFIQLNVNLNDWCVVGFGTETIEIIHIKTAQIVQRVMRGVPVKFLGRWDESVPREGKKNKSIFKSLFWSCAANERIHVYMLKADDVIATLPLP